MKTFKFPLESLRTLRKQREHIAQQCYARALAACEAAERTVQHSEATLKAGREALVAELAAGSMAGRIIHIKTWCTVLEIRRNECAAALNEARRLAREAFRVMSLAIREREALDQFHDKSERKWQRTAQAEEQKMFDELAVQSQSGTGLGKTLLN